MDKEEQKALKKKLKTEAKIAKAKAKAESGKSPAPPPVEKKKKSWRDNVFLYSLVAIMIGIILWFLAYFFDLFFRAPQIPSL